MKRRNFFATLLAPLAARWMPKVKIAPPVYHTVQTGWLDLDNRLRTIHEIWIETPDGVWVSRDGKEWRLTAFRELPFHNFEFREVPWSANA